jgi:hypothetical protein
MGQAEIAAFSSIGLDEFDKFRVFNINQPPRKGYIGTTRAAASVVSLAFKLPLLDLGE